MMLHLSLQDNQEPLYVQIYQQIKQQIRNGTLPENYQLPSKRQLAAQMHISVNTVSAAYSQLVSEGFLTAKPQKGFFVCHLDELIQTETAEEKPKQSVSTAPSLLVDFSINDVARDKFPFQAWRKAMNKCFNEYDPGLLTSTPPQGDYKLRQAIARYVYQARGVSCTAEQVIVGAGNDNLLQMLSYILDSSCTIGMENPVYHKAMHFFQRMGHRVESF
ncbi:MAG: aminotransferase class I/II-fold pyridoxal phosphate-dependent enzyme, partial [Peptococcaceae bacterium]|nr:aminotransferase class I/II-fold pyridoxal phosphate-dependent enzyme [Peptococcaceae bacterium]